jgi:preprotein translocase SecE subunit
MANGFQQYLKDTRSELNHVAWPTRTQTIVYTALVVLISLGVSLYLSLFDSIFTTGLSRMVTLAPSNTSNVSAAVVDVATGTPTSTDATTTIPVKDSGVTLPNLDDSQNN